MDFKTGENDKPSLDALLLHQPQSPVPFFFQLLESLYMKINDRLGALVGARHIGPVGLPGYRTEIEALPGVLQRFVQAADGIGNSAVIMQIAVIDI